MKNLNYLLLGLAGLTIASCSQEDLVGPAQGDGNFNITVKLPGNMGSRADDIEYGNGLSADILKYAVYEVNQENGAVSDVLFTGQGSFGGKLQLDLSLYLINKKSYKIAFFAVSEAGQTVYEFNTEDNVINVHYDQMDANQNNADAYDCFYNIYSTGVISTGGPSHSVTLTRPVAQINWGANDINANQDIINTFGKNATYVQSTLTTTAYSTLDMMTGLVTGEAQSVTLPAFNVPSGYIFPVESTKYQYIAMQYILASQTSSVSNLTLNLSNTYNNEGATVYENEVVVTSAPIQANYRTNIYGALLSNPTDFVVKKDPIFTNEYDTEVLPTITVSPDDLNGFTIGEDGMYFLSGNIESGNYTINVNPGLNVIVDGTGLKASDENEMYNLYFTSPGLPDHPDDITSAKPRTGNYTYRNFNAGVLSVKTGNTTVNIENNVLNFFDLGAGNLNINIIGNSIDGKGKKYPRWDDVLADCGIYLYMIDYDLVFDNNTITNAGGNPLQINGWAANDGNVWTADNLLNLNHIKSFSGNTITVTEYKSDSSSWTGAIVFYGDGTYYWTNTLTGNDATFTPAFDTFKEMVTTSDNHFYIGGDADGAYTYKLSQLLSGNSVRFDPITEKAPEVIPED